MNAVIYARYSSHNQTEQSIEGQLRDNYEWAKQHGVTVIGEYIDRAKSGTKDNRADFQRMIRDAGNRQFETIIVWKLDRFARNRYDSAIYKAQLKLYGVKVVSVKEAITDSPEGIILEGLLESMAEYYSANLAQNILRGQRESMAKGQYAGGGVPYGYKLVDKRFVIDEKTGPVMKYVFEQYAAGVPKIEIINALNARGVRGKRGAPLTRTSFQKDLCNTAYIGKFVYKGEVVEGVVTEPLISEELFYKVQDRLQTVARAPATGTSKKVDYLLSGKVFCGHCGSTMIGVAGLSRHGTKYYYYVCSGKRRHEPCKKKSERKELIEEYVVTQTLAYVLSPKRITRIAKAVAAEYDREFSDDSVSTLEKDLVKLNREIDNLVEALTEAPKVARQRIYDRMTLLEAQKSDLETDIARLRIAAGIRLTEADVLSWLSEFRHGSPDDPVFRKRVIDVFINAIYLYDDRTVVFYNIRGGKEVTPDVLLSSLNSPSGCTSVSSSPHEHSKVEPRFIFIEGVFGCIFSRKGNLE